MTIEKKIAGLYRLAVATAITGFASGFIFHAVISMPPVWLECVG